MRARRTARLTIAVAGGLAGEAVDAEVVACIDYPRDYSAQSTAR